MIPRVVAVIKNVEATKIHFANFLFFFSAISSSGFNISVNYIIIIILLLFNTFIIHYIVYRLYMFQPSEMKKLTNKEDDPPRLVYVRRDRAMPMTLPEGSRWRSTLT